MKKLKITENLEHEVLHQLYLAKNKEFEGEFELKAVLMDEEGDPINCTFNNDFCVNIDTSDITYMTLSVENLDMLWDLILESQEYFVKEHAKELKKINNKH
jgi:hypothetical protein